MTEADPATQNMTIGQWNQQEHPIRWSIYDPESYAQYEQEAARIPLDRDGYPTPDNEARFRAAYTRITLNLAAPPEAPDGVYPVFHQNLGRTGRGEGAVIEQRRFRLPETADAALSAVCQAMNTTPDRLDHMFIEGWNYDPDTGRLYVRMGS